LWLFVILFSIFPRASEQFARLFGITRGLDFIIIVVFVVLFYILFRLFNRIDILQDEINKIACWCATGAGKTLLMHINKLQVEYYAEKYGVKFNNLLLVTPNAGLSRQHISELEAAIKMIESRMSTIEGASDMTLIEKHMAFSQQLNKAMDEWTAASEQLEELNNQQ
jgi:hypothetical protein